MIVFPLLAGVMGFGICLRLIGDWRRSLLIAAVTWRLVLLGITELLSAFGALDRSGVIVAWLAVDAAAAVALWRVWRKPGARVRPAGERLGVVSATLVAVVGLICLTLAYTARRGVPLNHDSHTYHMARIMHWEQNRSVAFYPTHITRQVQQPPLSEYSMLHTMVLQKDDRLANFTQWGAMVLSVVAASYVARQLGASVRGQVLAAVACATIPMGVLQAVSTQNDYFAAFHLLCAVAFGIDTLQGTRLRAGTGEAGAPRFDYVLASSTGAALGMALLSKATAYVFAFPFVVALGALMLWRHGRRAVTPLAVIAVVAFAINAPHYGRNGQLTGKPLGPPAEEWAGPYTNAEFSGRALASNLLRNTVTQLATPWPGVNDRLVEWARSLHAVIGLDPDDARFTWAAFAHTFRLDLITSANIPDNWRHEDLAPSPVHFLLTVAAIVSATFLARAWRRAAWGYALLLTASYLLFCLTLRWQQWNVRLLLQLLVVACPLVALVMDRLWNRYAAVGVAVALVAVAMPYLLANQRQRLVGPNSIVFKDREQQAGWYYESYRHFAREIGKGNHTRIGLIIGGNTPEYPWWVALRERNPDVRIEHVNVTNFTGPLAKHRPFRSFQPTIVIYNPVNDLSTVKLLPPDEVMKR